MSLEKTPMLITLITHNLLTLIAHHSTMHKNAITLFSLLFFVFSGCKSQQKMLSNPAKREFRGVWIATVDNIDWPVKGDTNSLSQQKDFIRILDEHQRSNFNAVLVQVRDACDAYYAKSSEPWSEFLTGKQGRNPEPFYDPMAFMIEESHNRNMEFHAWLNLNRAVFKTAKSVTPDHISNTKPEWILTYDGQKLLNFGIPEVRDYITGIVVNIVKNYDVDGIHFDDYFYPYKAPNQVLQDEETFKKYNNGFKNIDDWRRYNTDLLIKQIADAIKAEKPFMKFGISPFGVWKNYSKKDKDGSLSQAGQTSYYDLYADTRKWMELGWIDYMLPQVYFPFQHKLVPYEPLVDWWTKHTYGRHLYIGQAAYRLKNTNDPAWQDLSQMPNQIRYNREQAAIGGSVYFSSKSITQNFGGFQDSLRADFYRYPAIIPSMPWKDNTPPNAPKNLKLETKEGKTTLTWEQPEGEAAHYFVIYRFEQGDSLSLESPAKMLKITRSLSFTDTKLDKKKPCTYIVTSFDRLHNESKPEVRQE